MAGEKRDGGQTVIERSSKTALKKPPLYKVLLHNDDFTPRDFVVVVLRQVFVLGDGEAQACMQHAHVHGVAVVGLYTFEIAEMKVKEAMDISRDQQFPLMFTCEPE